MPRSFLVEQNAWRIGTHHYCSVTLNLTEFIGSPPEVFQTWFTENFFPPKIWKTMTHQFFFVSESLRLSRKLFQNRVKVLGSLPGRILAGPPSPELSLSRFSVGGEGRRRRRPDRLSPKIRNSTHFEKWSCFGFQKQLSWLKIFLPSLSIFWSLKYPHSCCPRRLKRRIWNLLETSKNRHWDSNPPTLRHTCS